MKQQQRFDLSHFEVLSEAGNGTLVGGFSAAVAGSALMDKGGGLNISKCGETNNCQGGNCATGCGTTTPKPPTTGPVTA